MGIPKIIVALDGMDLGTAITLAQKLQGTVWGFKLNDLLDEYGVSAIEKLSSYGAIMADDKIYDIPNTAINKVRRFERAGATLITVHASGGQSMLQACVQQADRSKIIAVTALTSYDDEEFTTIYNHSRTVASLIMTRVAHEAKVHGIVCAYDFLPKAPLNNIDGDEEFLRIVPGVRPQGKKVRGEDQMHAADPSEMGLATHIVVGRPITQALEPLKAAKEIASSLERKLV